MGLVVSPIGLGVYYLGYMIPFVGLFFIFLYAFVLSSHSAAGFEILSYFFHVKVNSTALSIERLYAELINGIIWGSFYGGLGFIVDKLRRKNNKNENKPQQFAPGDAG